MEQITKIKINGKEYNIGSEDTKTYTDEKVSELREEIDEKLAKAPFNKADAGKFVVVAEDGTLAAIEIATGGSY